MLSASALTVRMQLFSIEWVAFIALDGNTSVKYQIIRARVIDEGETRACVRSWLILNGCWIDTNRFEHILLFGAPSMPCIQRAATPDDNQSRGDQEKKTEKYIQSLIDEMAFAQSTNTQFDVSLCSRVCRATKSSDIMRIPTCRSAWWMGELILHAIPILMIMQIR